MSDIKRRAAACKHVTHSPNNTRVYELSRLARHLFPDGQGDYTLPETSIGKHLAVALITHLARAGQRDSRWLVKFCADRVPWLDPDNIDVTTLLPDKAYYRRLRHGAERLRTRRRTVPTCVAQVPPVAVHMV
jgi:hypothetical protein